jgi:hypothetical protein
MGRIAKLWRGELTLREAFWIWGVVGTVALSLGSQFLVSRLIAAGFVSGLLALGITLIVVGVGYLVLVSVGIWRSAGRYAGPKVWLWASRGIVIAVVALNVSLLVGGTMQLGRDTNDPGKTSCNIQDSLKPTADYPFVGFWERSCSDGFGLAIDAQKDGFYSVSFCGPGGCFKPGTYRPNTRLAGDSNYKILDTDTIEVLGSDGFSRYVRCNKPPVATAACR